MTVTRPPDRNAGPGNCTLAAGVGNQNMESCQSPSRPAATSAGMDMSIPTTRCQAPSTPARDTDLAANGIESEPASYRSQRHQALGGSTHRRRGGLFLSTRPPHPIGSVFIPRLRQCRFSRAGISPPRHHPYRPNRLQEHRGIHGDLRYGTWVAAARASGVAFRAIDIPTSRKARESERESPDPATWLIE